MNSSYIHPYGQNTSPTQYGTSSGRIYGTDIGSYEGGVERERRHVQSVVLNEEYLGARTEDTVTYVEVPYVEEVIRHVPRREIVEIEKRVPKYEVEYVERVVEVPQIHYVDKTVEIPQIHEVIRHVPKRETIEIPKEYIKHVPKIETRLVEKIVEVPGEIIEIPKPYTVENKVPITHYVDKEVPMVVAQTLRPIVSEAKEQVEVDVVEYEPEVIPVDIHVPKAMPTQLVARGMVDEIHRLVQVPPAQYNSMLRTLNPHLGDKTNVSLPYITQNGSVPFLSTDPVPQMQPLPNTDIIGWSYYQRGQMGVPTYQGTTTQRSMSVREPVAASRYSKSNGTGTSTKGISAMQYSHLESSTKRSGVVSSTVRRPRKVRGGCPC